MWNIRDTKLEGRTHFTFLKITMLNVGESSLSCNDIAVFYPNLRTLSRCKVLVDEATHAVTTNMVFSNDEGTACSEMRHFIDSAALASLDGGQELLETLGSPVPPCEKISGKCMDGMSK